MPSRLQLSVSKVDPLPDPARSHLTEAVLAGRDVMMNVDFGALYGQRAKAATQFLFRRWVLRILIALRARGPMTYNEIKQLLGGLAGGSLSPKLQAMQSHGLLEQQMVDKTMKYQLRPDADIVGSAAYTLTLGKAQRYRHLTDADYVIEIPTFTDWAGDPTEPGYEAAVQRFAMYAEQFAQEHDSSTREKPETTALRFTEACVHYWHGPVLVVAEFSGGATYSELKAALGLSDAALSKALQGLAEVGSLARDAKDMKYRITSGGRFDMSLGFGLPAVLAKVWEEQGRFPDGSADAQPDTTSD